MPRAVLVAFFALMFGPTLLDGRIILIGDPLKQFYPIRTVVWQMIRDGHLPLWLPHILSGYPSMGMVMLGIGYPLTWGYLFLAGPWGEQVYILAPYFLAPLFTYAFLREWKRSEAASVLGGLTFGYGGFLLSPIGLTGVHANSALWLPLLLLGIARARRTRFPGPLLLATLAYTMSILAGSAQMFLYGGAIAVSYGLFLTLFPNLDEVPDARPPRWQPLAVAIGAIAAAAGVAAFQMLETWTAVHESVRESYPAARVEEGSFPIAFACRSLLQPLGNYWDSSTFVPLLALVLAGTALFTGDRTRSHVYFWSFVALSSWLLILGNTTPLFAFYTRIPFTRMFRYPSRHSMEWTFAIGVLAAYGWDRVETIASRFHKAEGRRNAAMVTTAAILAVIAASLSVPWSRYTHGAGLDVIPDLNNVITRLDSGYMRWKLAFTLCIAISIVLLWSTRPTAMRRILLTLAAAIACFAEPYVWMIKPVVATMSVQRSMFDSFAKSTLVVRKHLRGLERTYSLANPYAVETSPQRNIDAVNWTALAGMEDVNGYESLIMSRYSRAFRGYVDTEPWIGPDRTLFGMESPLLDLLNVKYVIGYEHLSAGPFSSTDKDGVSYASSDLNVDVKGDTPFMLDTGATDADSLAVVSTLGNSGKIENGAAVARVTVHTADGKTVERELLAGVHTSEFAYDRPDVISTTRHARAPIFDSSPGEGQFQNHRFVGRIDFGERLRITRIDFVKMAAEVTLQVWKASLVDSANGKSIPLPLPPVARWRTIWAENGVVVLENRRALPRAWLVSKVRTVDENVLLRMVRGEGALGFDPATTALMETTAGPKTDVAVADFARTAVDGPMTEAEVALSDRQPGRLVFQTTTSRRALLVISELFYPGWLAKVDGVYTPIHRTDYLLRGVFVPAGHHTVEMFYYARGARRGRVISVIAIALLGIVTRWPRRRAR